MAIATNVCFAEGNAYACIGLPFILPGSETVYISHRNQHIIKVRYAGRYPLGFLRPSRNQLFPTFIVCKMLTNQRTYNRGVLNPPKQCVICIVSCESLKDPKGATAQLLA